MLEYVMTWGWCMKLGLWDSLTVGHWDLRVGQILKHLSCEQKTYLRKKQCPSNLTIVTTQELNIWILIARSLWWTLFIPCAAFAKFPRPSTAGAMHLFDMVSVCVRGNACVIYRIWGQKKTKSAVPWEKTKGRSRSFWPFSPMYPNVSNRVYQTGAAGAQMLAASAVNLATGEVCSSSFSSDML